jgi:hypothetical protein
MQRIHAVAKMTAIALSACQVSEYISRDAAAMTAISPLPATVRASRIRAAELELAGRGTNRVLCDEKRERERAVVMRASGNAAGVS